MYKAILQVYSYHLVWAWNRTIKWDFDTEIMLNCFIIYSYTAVKSADECHILVSGIRDICICILYSALSCCSCSWASSLLRIFAVSSHGFKKRPNIQGLWEARWYRCAMHFKNTKKFLILYFFSTIQHNCCTNQEWTLMHSIVMLLSSGTNTRKCNIMNTSYSMIQTGILCLATANAAMPSLFWSEECCDNQQIATWKYSKILRK